MPKDTTERRSRKPAPLYRSNLRNDHLANMYGIEPCEALLLAYADEDREPRDGERVFMHYARDGMGCGCIKAGTYRKAPGGFFIINDDDDGTDPERLYEGDQHHYLMRLVGVVRDDKPAWFDARDAGKWAGVAPAKLRESDLLMSEEEYVAEFGQTWEERWGIEITRGPDGKLLRPDAAGDARRAQIARLRARLRHLDEQDEITACTARFQLEKKIYDLEHAPDPDDWPEYINTERGAR